MNLIHLIDDFNPFETYQADHYSYHHELADSLTTSKRSFTMVTLSILLISFALIGLVAYEDINLG